MTYANRKVERAFTDYSLMRRKMPYGWARQIKKHIERLEAAVTFGDFLTLGLGKPEMLLGYEQIRYSLHVAKQARLIIELHATQDTITTCNQVEIEGVCDYHGCKENWYYP